MDTSDKIQWVYGSRNNQELGDRYNQWAKDYERDLAETFGRPDREPIVDLVLKYVAKEAHILDAGAGTGLLGQWLHAEGYRHLAGIDLSSGMLSSINLAIGNKWTWETLGFGIDWIGASYPIFSSLEKIVENDDAELSKNSVEQHTYTFILRAYISYNI